MVKQFFAKVVLIHKPWERSRGRFFPKSPIHITQITLMIHKLSTHTTLLNDPKHILNWIVLLSILSFICTMQMHKTSGLELYLVDFHP